MNNNNKKPLQKQKNNKHKKVRLFLGFGLGALVAGATTTLLSQIGRFKEEKDLKHDLNFNLSDADKAQGATLTGETKFKFKDEVYLSEIQTPVAEKTVVDGSTTTNYPFVDWVNQKGLTVKYNDAITETTSLTATFSDYWEKKGISLCTVEFKTDDQELYFSGATKIAVPIGRTFASINKPQVHSTNPVKNKFKGWALEDSPTYTVNQDLVITQNLVFVPVFSTSVIMQYHCSEAKGEVLESGQLQVPTEAGVKFGEIAQPTISNTNGQMAFAGWSRTEEPPETGEDEMWKVDDEIPATESLFNAYPRWLEKRSANRAAIDFVQNETTGQPNVTFLGSKSISVNLGSKWIDINRPTPEASGWKIDYWEYSIDSKQNWLKLTDDKTFDTPSDPEFVYYVRPVMAPNADAVKILGKDMAVQGMSTQYTAFVAPAEADQSVTWKLYKDEGCATVLPSSIATISATGLLNVKIADSQPIYIKAIAKADKTEKVYDVKKVTLVPPYYNSYDYFTLCDSITNGSKWYKLTGLDGSEDIQMWDDETLVATVARADFNYPVYVGDRITTIPGQFLANCTSFNQPVVLTDKLVNIGPHFMYNCQQFNQQIDISKVQNIDKEFMFCCYKFNNGSNATTGVENHLKLDNVYTIGEGFLEQCTSFNSQVELGTQVTMIGNEFMNQCESYDKDISFPSSLQSIGDKCMHNCYSFASVITVDTNENNFGNSDLNFSGDKRDSRLFNQGYMTDGNRGYQFSQKFKSIDITSTTETGSAYRKVETATEFSNMTWKRMGILCNSLEQKQMTTEQFLSCFLINGKKVTSLSQFVGQEHDVLLSVNDTHSATYKAVIIGVNQDVRTGSQGACTLANVFTFQTKQVLSDENDDPLYVTAQHGWWNGKGGDRKGSIATGYGGSGSTMHWSTLKACLTGNITNAGQVEWKNKKGAVLTNYTRPVIDMFPEELKAQLKPARRRFYIDKSGRKSRSADGCSNFTDYYENMKVFIPTYFELCLKTDGYGADISSLVGWGEYAWYKQNGANRAKKSLNGTAWSHFTFSPRCYQPADDGLWWINTGGSGGTPNNAVYGAAGIAPCWCL